jgi:uncharacterized protein
MLRLADLFFLRVGIVFVFMFVLFVFVPEGVGLNFFDDVCFDSVCFDVRIADNGVERSRGLMYEKFLPEMTGMLFVFDNVGNHSFWMKNTYIPLDIVWIDEGLKVVSIKTVDPCNSERCEVFYGSRDSKFVLEIGAGLSSVYGISVGDDVSIN